MIRKAYSMKSYEIGINEYFILIINLTNRTGDSHGLISAIDANSHPTPVLAIYSTLIFDFDIFIPIDNIHWQFKIHYRLYRI